MSRHWSKFALLLTLTALFAASAFAQASGGALHGRVTDETGGALPGVTVTATNSATGFSRSTVTAADGAYSLPALPAGNYAVLADLAGFSSVTTKNVDVNVATDRALNVTLKQAAVKEQITVTAEAPLVATSPSVCIRRSPVPALRCWGLSPTASSQTAAPTATPTSTPTGPTSGLRRNHPRTPPR